MKIDAATKILDRVAGRTCVTDGKLMGVNVEIRPQAGHIFVIRMNMEQKGTMEAAKRLNDIAGNVSPWPPSGIVEATLTWDSTLHYLVMTGDLKVK